MSRNVSERHVRDTPQNRQLFALDKCLELAVHTIKICRNENIFDPKYSAVTDRIVKTTNDAYILAFLANDRKVTDSETRAKRLKMQYEAIKLVHSLLPQINLAQRLFHFRRKKRAYWIRLVRETYALMKKWHESDRKRYDRYK